MNLSQIMAQAQKMQRELRKAKDALASKEFTLSKNGMVNVTMLGNKTIKSIDIDKDALDVENKEKLEESIALCINELLEEILSEEEAINEKITGSSNGGGLF